MQPRFGVAGVIPVGDVGSISQERAVRVQKCRSDLFGDLNSTTTTLKHNSRGAAEEEAPRPPGNGWRNEELNPLEVAIAQSGLQGQREKRRGIAFLRRLVGHDHWFQCLQWIGSGSRAGRLDIGHVQDTGTVHQPVGQRRRRPPGSTRGRPQKVPDPGRGPTTHVATSQAPVPHRFSSAPVRPGTDRFLAAAATPTIVVPPAALAAQNLPPFCFVKPAVLAAARVAWRYAPSWKNRGSFPTVIERLGKSTRPSDTLLATTRAIVSHSPILR